MLRRLMKAQEVFFPSLFHRMQYAWHVTLWRALIYPDVTRPIFKAIGSQNKVAIDVGANYGLATRYLSKYFRQTHAIEPVPFLARRLGDFRSQGVVVHNCAVGDCDDPIRMRTPVDDNGRMFHALSTVSPSNTLRMFRHAGIVEFDVAQRRLNDLLCGCAGVVGYIKIDVEGFEAAVLRGGQALIERDRPFVQIEIEQTHNPDGISVVAFMEALGYHVYSITPRGLRDDARAALSAQSVCRDLSENAVVWHQYDFLFAPREQVGAIARLIR